MKKRILSLCLCLILAVGLLPLAAMAADITSVSISGLDHPVDGRTLDTTYTLPGGAAYTKDTDAAEVTWYDQGTGGFTSVKYYGATPSGTKLSAGAKAVGGHYYVAELRLSRTGSGMFPKKEFTVNVSDVMSKRVMNKQGWSESTSMSSYNGAVYLYYQADQVYSAFNPLYLSLNKAFNGVLFDGEAQWTASDFTNDSFIHSAKDFDLIVSWSQSGHALAANEKFAAGRDYTLTLTFDAAKTTRHASFDTDDWYVVLNSTYYDGPNVTNGGLTATVSFTFPCVQKITTLDIENIEVPVAGQPMQTGGFSVAPAKLKSVEWYKYIGSIDAPTSGNFEANTNYYVKLTLTPPAGHAFAMGKSDVSANLGEVTSYTLTDEGEAIIRISFKVGEVPDIIISEAEIDINAPKLEEAPSFLAAADGEGYVIYDDDGGSYIGGVCWTDVTVDDHLTDDERVLKTHPDDPFLPGHTYQVSVELIAQDGYTFTESTAAVLNGETTEAMLQGDILRVSYTFAPLPILTSIEIITPPDKTEYEVGESFDPTGMVVRAAYSDGSYKEVTNYAVPVEPLTEADESVGVIYIEGGITQVAELKIQVGTPLETIDEIDLTIEAPKVGRHPSYSAAATGEHYRVYTDQALISPLTDGVAWLEADTLKELIETEEPMKPTAVFKAEKYYLAVIAVVPEDGYAFDASLLAEGAKITVNGKANGQATDFGENALMIQILFQPMEAGKEIGFIDLTIEAPKADAGVSFTGTVPEDANYTLESIHWYCDEDDEALQAGDRFGKKTYILNATFAPKEGYAFAPDSDLTGEVNGQSSQTRNIDEGKALLTQYFSLVAVNPFKDIFETDYFYDAVMWAYYAEPQVTNGIHADEFGPDRTVTRGQAVTFLWRAMGCPEPETAENPFEDVKENQYYYKAVLWANEKGITNGTSATRFTPNQTCSTAHIITFLYRTITGKANAGWYEVAEAWAGGAGLLDGLDIEVKPGVDCPRCDVVLFLYRELAK